MAPKLIKTCVLEKDDNLKISLLGLITLLIYQTFIHVGVNTSLLPTTGMTLPFLSYGGSSLIGSAISAGIILNITKNRYLDNGEKSYIAVISTGGTGGHIFPACGLLEILKNLDYKVELVSDKRGLTYLDGNFQRQTSKSYQPVQFSKKSIEINTIFVLIFSQF